MSSKDWVFAVAIGLFTTAIAILPLFFDMVRKDNSINKRPLLDRITFWGRLTLIFAIIIILLSLWKNYDDFQNNKSESANLVKTIVNEINISLLPYNLKYDRLGGTTRKKDTITINNSVTKNITTPSNTENFVDPILDVYVKGSPNPIIKRSYYLDSNVLMAGISSIIPNGIATKLDINNEVLNYKNGILTNVTDPFTMFKNIKEDQFESSYSLYNDKILYLNIYLGKYEKLYTDTNFLYIKVKYSNIKGKPQKALTKVYIILPGQIEKQLQLANPTDFHNVINFFIRKSKTGLLILKGNFEGQS